MTAARTQRPALVTVLVILIVLSGLSAILSGVIGMVTFGGFAWGALILVVVGVIYWAVAKGLADGSDTARMICAAVAIVQIVGAVIIIINQDDTGTRTSAIITGVLAVLVLVILFSPSANAYFKGRAA
jgi:hypothetical protein